jgi:serine/arginine repetitive matrix protein 1
LQVIRPWVAKKVVELVGFEDEVLIEYAMGLLEDESQPVNSIYLIFHPCH